MSLTDESLKGYWHVGLAIVFGATAIYNGLKFLVTKRRQNALNAILYAGLTVYEIRLAKQHWSFVPDP